MPDDNISVQYCPRCGKPMDCTESMQKTTYGIRRVLVCVCDDCGYGILDIAADRGETENEKTRPL